MQQIGTYIEGGGLVAISRIICLGLLISLAVMDLRYRRVSSSMLMTGSALAAGYCLLFDRAHIWLSFGGLVIGLLFVGVSKVTEEKLGYGDSWLLCILGMYLGTWNLLELLLTAWMAAALTAIVVLALHRCRRGTVLPMVPFIAVGYIAVWISEIVGY